MHTSSRCFTQAIFSSVVFFDGFICAIIACTIFRFTVSAVDTESKKNGIHMGASIISRPLRSSVETVEKGDPAQPDTWLHDAGWRRKRSLAQLTREALPRMENYRNSRRALKRPSLGEIHGDHLITEEVSS